MKMYQAELERWLHHPQLLPSMKSELLAITDEQEQEDRFYTNLPFGTAGMRGVIGAGTNRINFYTIRRATHGLARHLLSQSTSNLEKGIVIAYDSRLLSRELAEEAAGTLAYCGFNVYLFQELRPTPLLSFAVRHLQAAGGIVITASHNPPEYNGYKVYQSTGRQISESTAEAIWREISSMHDCITLPTLSLAEGMAQGRIMLIGKEIDSAYLAKLSAIRLNPEVMALAEQDLRIAYTPLHGTGLVPIREALLSAGFSHLHVVNEQAEPDGYFSTVTSPNPEDPQAFTLAIQLAKEKTCDLVLATDPDTDRVGMMVCSQKNVYVMLTGNQIGALMLYYLLEQRSRLGTLPSDGFAVNTIVTSDLGRKIAAAYSVKMESTLTGFKHIAEIIEQYETLGDSTFLFGYEESYGYLYGDFVRDKDAVQAAMLLAEMAAFYKQQGETLLDVLEKLHQRFGYHCDLQHSITCKGKAGLESISRIMETLRTNLFDELNGQKVLFVKDYLTGIDELPSANVLKFILSDSSWIALRPSGTEPKMKLYISTVARTDAQAQQQANAILQYMVAFLDQLLT